MKALLFAALAALVAADAADPDTVVLTDTNFDEFVSGDQAVLVEFYAPWCGHCKKLAPEYAKAATVLKKQNIQIGKLDATEYGDVASRFDVSGYPTLKVFRNGMPSPYDGPREAAGIIAFMRKEAAPAFVEFKTVDEASAHAEKLGQPVILGQFADAAAAAPFLKVANAQRDFSFAVIYGDAAGISTVVPAKPRYSALTAAKYDGDVTSDADILTYVQTSLIPVAGVSDDDSKHIYALSSLPVITLYVPGFDTENDPAGTKYFLNRLKKVAAEFEGKLIFAVANAAAAPFDTVSGAYTTGVVHNGAKFRADAAPAKGFDKAALIAFSTAFLAGDLEEFLKSEPIPTQDEDVTVLVGKNFRAETDGKAGLIEFYAPWCGHCKSLAPVWDKLGAKTKEKAPDVLIAKMDATANDVPSDFQVSGFPTIYYVDGKGGNEKYNGGRDLKDFTKFLKGKGHL